MWEDSTLFSINIMSFDKRFLQCLIKDNIKHMSWLLPLFIVIPTILLKKNFGNWSLSFQVFHLLLGILWEAQMKFWIEVKSNPVELFID